MFEVFPALLVLTLGCAGLFLVNGKYSAQEFQLIAAAYVAHIVACIVQIWVTYEVYGVGDMMTYQRLGVDLAQALRTDFAGVAPQAILMLFQQEYMLDVQVSVGSETTRSMYAITGFSNLLLADSLYGVSFLFATASFFGKLLTYQAFREVFERRFRIRMLVATMLVPSVVYWSSGIIKEAVALTGMGIVLLGGTRLLVKRSPRNVFVTLFGGLIVALIKPHLLFAMALGAGVWIYWQRSMGPNGVEIRPLYLLLGAAAGLGGVLLLGEIFPRFSLSSVGEEAAQMQFYAARQRGGSTYAIGDPNNKSLLGQLSYAPLGLFTALYRPLPFDVRNPPMLVNAIETTGLLALSIHAVWRRGVAGVWAFVNQRPMLMFCLVVALVLGTMTGLASANLGTLSRYRIPMVPFFVVLVLMCSAPGAATARSTAHPIVPRRPVPRRVRPRPAGGLPRTAGARS